MGSEPIEAPPDAAVSEADALMPGLTDVHWHTMFAPHPLELLEMAVRV